MPPISRWFRCLLLGALVPGAFPGTLVATERAPGPSAPWATPRPDSLLDAAIRRDLASSSATGAVLVLVDEAGVRQVEAVGFQDREREEPISPGHRAHLGNWGWILLSSVALRMEEAGVLELDAPASASAPGLAPGVGTASLEHLLLEAGGLDASPLVWRLPGEPPRRLPPDSLLALLRDSAVQAPPGLFRSPSPHHGLVASHLVEEAGGEPFEVLLDRHVVEPLGLEGTVSARPGMAPEGAHPGHQLDGSARGPYTLAPFPEPSVLLPHERVWATGHDLGRLVAAWMQDPDHLIELARPRVPEPGDPTGTTGYGLAFRTDGAGRFVAQGGGPGYTVVLHLYPARGTAYLILANGGASGMPRTLARLAARDEAAAHHATREATRPLAVLADMPVPALGLEPLEELNGELAGTYRNGSEIFRLVEGEGGELGAEVGLARPLPLRTAEGGRVEAFVEDGRTAMAFRLFRDAQGGVLALNAGVIFRREPVRAGNAPPERR